MASILFDETNKPIFLALQPLVKMSFPILSWGLRLGALALGLFHVQCTWTPEVTTSIFTNEQGEVTLRTSEAFRTSPSHPISLSTRVIKDMLKDVNYQREAGLLQELFNSPSSQSTPVFSQAQIDFLTPQISLALSQATPEEFVDFSCLGQKSGEATLKGSLAIFSPHIFFIAIETSKDSSGAPYVLPSQRNTFREFASIGFANPNDIVAISTVRGLIVPPHHAHWIAINYENLISDQGQDPFISSVRDKKINSPAKAVLEENDLKEEIMRLRRKIEIQNEELQQLRTPEP